MDTGNVDAAAVPLEIHGVSTTDGLDVASQIQLSLHIDSCPHVGNQVGLVVVVVDIHIHAVVALVTLPVRSQFQHHLLVVAVTEVQLAIFHDDAFARPAPRAIIDASVSIRAINQFRAVDTHHRCAAGIASPVARLLEH